MRLFKQRSLLLAAVAIVGLGGIAAAQVRRPAQQPAAPRGGQTAQAAPAQNMDHELAVCVALENDNEIAMAKLAQTRAESKEVTKFAQMMEKDHSQFAEDLKRFAGDIAALRQARPVRESDERTKNEPARSADGGTARREAAPRENPPAAARPAGANAQPANFHIQLKAELADECLQSAQHELLDKKGAEFDACYVGMQLAAHMHMVDTLKVFERHASPELKQKFQKGAETAQKHFDRAKQLMKDLDGVHTARRDKDAK